MSDGLETETYRLTEEQKMMIKSLQTHVVYCPDCRDELGRGGDKGQAREAADIHHIGTGHSPRVLSGAYANE